MVPDIKNPTLLISYIILNMSLLGVTHAVYVCGKLGVGRRCETANQFSPVSDRFESQLDTHLTYEVQV